MLVLRYEPGKKEEAEKVKKDIEEASGNQMKVVIMEDTMTIEIIPDSGEY